MEQPPNEQPEELHGDLAQIEMGIDYARTHDAVIDDGTVRRIASQLHDGQASALYSLASAGAVDREGLDAELLGMEVSDDTPPEVRPWLVELRRYIAGRSDDGPVEGWYLTTADAPVTHEEPDDQPEDDDSDAELEPEPRVWVGALAARNDGDLHGTWVRANRGVEYLQRHVDAILQTSPVEDEEEWYIADTENFKGLDIHEYATLQDVAELGRLVHAHGEPFVHYAKHVGLEHVDQLAQRYQDAYRGEWSSVAEYVEDQLTEREEYEFMDHAPEWLRDFISVDLEGIANLWSADGLIAIQSYNHAVTYIYQDPEA